ncbi:MAG: galactose-1-phosphate uridylyltransferase [Candidatus Paceibacterota bacterium]|jgi:UDPglucose--hexose-1-phosphate uridylyltransferase
MEQDKEKFPSELRLDLVSKDWVVIATGRGKRPEMFKNTREEVKSEIKKENCPFCNIDPGIKASAAFLDGKEIDLSQSGYAIPQKWTTLVIPNKFPAFIPAEKLEERTEGGLYLRINAVGYHDLVLTKDHGISLANLPQEKVKEVFDAYQARYLQLKKFSHVNYVSIFHNHGPSAGASQPHPHSQIITSPLIDVDLENALSIGKKYYEENKKCLYCEMTEWELKTRERIVFENDHFLALCPFASKSAFQVIVTPKAHKAYFEEITEEEKEALAEAFKAVLFKIYKGLNNPDYNFYLHTSPCSGEDYDFYHWHWTIMPKTSVWAGFEIGSRMEISTIEPEKAAEYLRQQ